MLCSLLRHVGLLHHLHVVLSRSDTLRSGRRKHRSSHLHLLLIRLALCGFFCFVVLFFEFLVDLVLEVQTYGAEYCICRDKSAAHHVENCLLVHVVLDKRCLVKAYRHLIEHMHLTDSVYKPSETVVKVRREVNPLPLKHSETHRRCNCLECSLSDLQRNGHILQNSVLVPLHQLHRCKLLRLAAKHLIVERERRYNPLRGVLSDTFNGLHNEVLDSMTADRLPKIVLTGKKLLCRRTDHSYRSNEVGCNRLVELVKICQSENVVEAAQEQRSTPALVESVH